MAIKYSYTEEDNTVRVEAAGVLSICEIETYVKAVINDEEIRAGFVEIFNLKGVQDFDFTFRSGRKVVLLYSQLLRDKQFRGAIHISPGHIQYGISHIMTAMLEDVSMIFTVSDKSEIEVALNQFLEST